MCNIPEIEELAKGPTLVAYVDGSSTNQRSGVGVTLTSPEGQKFKYAIKFDFATTNNEAEYEAVLAGLSIAQDIEVANVEIRSDSQVVVGQINEGFTTQGDMMVNYLEKVCQFQSYFDEVVLTKIPREENIQADALSRVGSGTEQEIQATKEKVLVKTEPLSR